MLLAKENQKYASPKHTIQKTFSPNAKSIQSGTINSGLKIKTLSDLKPIKPSEKSGKNEISRHEKSFSGLYSKFMQKAYSETHEIGYSASDIVEAVSFIFQKYDSNKDGMLDRKEVKRLIEESLRQMGSTHSPSELEIIEFIYSMDKNHDGKLSRTELEAAFIRANRIDY
jgi:hypothetical protein